MTKFKLNDRVRINILALSLSYIKDNEDLILPICNEGEVIGYATTGKVAVQFDKKVFNCFNSYYDSGCHGKGLLGHCIYLPEYALDLIEPISFNWDSIKYDITSDESILITI